MSAPEVVSYEETHHINMGKFEFVEVKASVTLQVPDGEDARYTLESARKEVQNFIAEDLERAIQTTAEDESYVEAWLDGPRRSRKRRRREV